MPCTVRSRNLQPCPQVPPLPEALPQGEEPTADGVQGHLKSGMAYHASLQSPDGHFPGDYGGPMFLMPGMIIALYVTGAINTVLSPHHRREMVRYLKNHQNADGGVGLHIEGSSTMFGTALTCAPTSRCPQHGTPLGLANLPA